MTAPNLQFFDSSDVLLVGQQALGTANPGTATTPLEVRLFNNKDGAGADTAKNRFLQILVRNPGEANYVSAGHESADQRWFEIRILAATHGVLTSAATSFRRLGSGRLFEIPEIPNDGGVAFEIRTIASAGATAADVEIAFRVTTRQSIPLPEGQSEGAEDGVDLGIGDEQMTQLLKTADAVENPAAADDKVEIQDTVAVVKGFVFTFLKQLITVTDVDGDAATLVATESYFSLIYVDSLGAINQAKGSKTTSPTASDEPALPDGGLAIVMVQRDFDALINDADLDARHLIGAAHATTDVASLSPTIGPMRGLVDNNTIQTTFAETVVLTGSSTNRVWRLADGTLQVTTTAVVPAARALLIWELTTDGSGVTGTVDKRKFLTRQGAVQRLDFQFDATLVVGQKERVHFPSLRDGVILPFIGISFALLDDPGSSASVILDINLRPPAGAFTTIFTSQGSEDRRPTFANGASPLDDRDSLPEVTDIPAYSVLEVEVDAITGGGAPTAMFVTLLVAIA